jgi:hypothetical protein
MFHSIELTRFYGLNDATTFFSTEVKAKQGLED